MSSHAAKVKSALADFTAAVGADDRPAAEVALLDAYSEAMACHKAKSSPHPKAASATSTAADADVVTACDSATAALQASGATPQPATPAGATPAVTGIIDSLWSFFVANVAPSIIEWIKRRFAPDPNPVP